MGVTATVATAQSSSPAVVDVDLAPGLGGTGGVSFRGFGSVDFGPPDPATGKSPTSVQYSAKVPPNNFGIPPQIDVSGNGTVRFVADLIAQGTDAASGTPIFDPQPLQLEGTLNVRNGQPVVDDSLSFDLIDDAPALVTLANGQDLFIISHPVRGIAPGVAAEVGVVLGTSPFDPIGSTGVSPAQVQFSTVGGDMAVSFVAQPDAQLSQVLPDPIRVDATGTLSLLADVDLVSPVAGPFSLRLRGSADVDDNGQINANSINFGLFGGAQPAGSSGLFVVGHGISPEPGSLVLLSLGSLAVAFRRRAA
ncbi:MAG: hypothetical protein CMJ18_10840 [Phycisphaeraceae bacterium]|nr:hypothetical protein [Phycisphaeraceae bacterium]